jgi:hypothetical protein
MWRFLMDGMSRKAWFASLLGLHLFAGCRPDCPLDSLPAPSDTLQSAGRRLSEHLGDAKLTAIASRGSLLLNHLSASERDALSRSCLRVYVNTPVEVEIAAPRRTVPFWVTERGFLATGFTLINDDAVWVTFRKSFPRGWIGLGVNGLDRTPPAHYVVFLRSASGDPQLGKGNVTLGPREAGDWTLVVAKQGISAAHDVYRPFAWLPPHLENSLLLQPLHDRRHAAMLAKGRVWKTHVPSDALPDQVAISFGTDPCHELVWSWRTSSSARDTAIRVVPARFEAAENDSRNQPDLTGMRLVRGESRLVRSPDLLNDPVIRRHHVKVGGLLPDTTYLYSLGDGTSQGWGPWRMVKTGRPHSERIEFLYMGDAQTGLEDWGRRLTTAFRRHPGVDFIMLAGDLVDRGNERTNWDHFFLRAEAIFERVPLMPCVGNHEYLDMGPRLYRSFFELPPNGPVGVAPGLVYQFETGDAFFGVLDSTLAVSSPREARRQAEWLDEALAHTRARWKFVMFHHPVYPSHTSRDNPIVREFWVPVFDKHHVDMVLQGHDHAYLRTHPMRADRAVATFDEGTIYVVSVSGDKFYDQEPRHYTEVGLTRTSTYQTIEIDNVENRLTYRAWTDAGKIVDNLTISKPSTDCQPAFAQRSVSGTR